MCVVFWRMWCDASGSHNALCFIKTETLKTYKKGFTHQLMTSSSRLRLPPHRLPVYLSHCLPVYLSFAERRSVVIGSCWMVWCSIRANKPARLVMAILRFLSCSNSSSSLYHWQTDAQTDRVTFRTPVFTLLRVTFYFLKRRLLTTRTRSRSTSARRSFSQQ